MLCPVIERLALVVSNRTTRGTLLAMFEDLNWWTRLREIVLVAIRPVASRWLHSSFDSTALAGLPSLRGLQALVMEGCDTQMVIDGALSCTQLTKLVIRSRRSPLSIPCRINNHFLSLLTDSERSISAAAAGVGGGSAGPPRNGLRHLEFDADAHLDGAASVMALLDNEVPSSTVTSDRVNALLEVLPFLEHLDIRRVAVHAPVIQGPLAQLTNLTELRIGIQDGQDGAEWTALSALGALNALAPPAAGSPWRSSSPTLLAAEPPGLPQQQQQREHATGSRPHKTATMAFEGNPLSGPLPRPCLPMLHLYVSRVTKSGPTNLLDAMLPLVPRLRTLFMTHRSLHPVHLFFVGKLTSLECLGLSFAVQSPDSAADHARGAGRARGQRVRSVSQLPVTVLQQLLTSTQLASSNPQQLRVLRALMACVERGDVDPDTDPDVDSDDADADLQMADVDFGAKVQGIGLGALCRLTQLRELHLKGPQRLVGMAGRGPANLHASLPSRRVMAPRNLPQAQRLPSLPRTPKAAPKAARMAEGQAKATAAAGLRSLPFPSSTAAAGGRTAGGSGSGSGSGSGTTSTSAHRQCLPSQRPSQPVRAMAQALGEMEAEAEWEDFDSDTGGGTATTIEGPGKSALMEAGCGESLWRSYLPRRRRNVLQMEMEIEMDQTSEDEDMEDEFVVGGPQDGGCGGRSGGRSGGRLAASGTGQGRDLKRSAENPLLHQAQRRQQQRLQRLVRKRPDSLPLSQKRKGGDGGGRHCRNGGDSVGITAHGRSGSGVCGLALESERFGSPLLSRDDDEEVAVEYEDIMQDGAEREDAPDGSGEQGMDLDRDPDLDQDMGPTADRDLIQSLQGAAAGGRMAARDGGNSGTGIGRWTTAGHGGGAVDTTLGAAAAAGAAAAIAHSVSGSNAGMAASVRRENGEDMSMAAGVLPPLLPLELFPRPPISSEYHEIRMNVIQMALDDLTQDRQVLRRAVLSLWPSDIAALRTHGSALEALTLYYINMPPTVVTELTSALPQLRRLGLRWANDQDVALGKRPCICGGISMYGAAAAAGTSSIADGNRRGSLEIATLPPRLESLELGGPVKLLVASPYLGGPCGSRQAPGPVWTHLRRLTLGKGIDLSCAALPALLARTPQITELQLLKPRGLEPADLASLKPLNRLRSLVVNFEPADMECQEVRRAMARGISCVAGLTALQELRWDVPDPFRRKRRLLPACLADVMGFMDHNVELCRQLSTLTGLHRLSLLSLPSCRHLVRRTEDLLMTELRNLPFLKVIP
ncbi:hypothetical protein Vretimale_18840 [Volvox reticuliferus]|nr:hypothetical protein Vretimale_18840 [Volvox reticuliferus]